MKKITTLFIALLFAFTVLGQTYLETGKGYNAQDVVSSQTSFSSYDINGNMVYGNDGDTIRVFDMETEEELEKYGKPSEYSSYPSFVTLSPDGEKIWAGFTVSDNSDDRIYRIDRNTGNWKLMATLAGNFDLEFLNDSILVSALDADDTENPNAIYVLDTTGNDNHREIVEMGGYTAGIAIDNKERFYYGQTDLKALYRWDSTTFANVLYDVNATTLSIQDAEKLTDLPAGPYDCEIDEAGHVLVNTNSSEKVLAKWNGTTGSGYNYDTLAYTDGSYDWFTFIKSKGDIMNPETGNAAYILSYGRPIAKVTRSWSPELVQPLENMMAYEDQENVSFDLSQNFSLQGSGELSYAIDVISDSSVVVASLDGNKLNLDFKGQGQSNVVVNASHNGLIVQDTMIVGVYPKIRGDYEVADFENLKLEDDSYWNGSDGSGGFTSALAYFNNNYNASYGTWDGWAYSNMGNDTTPGYSNQYSAITAAGFDSVASKGSNYGVSYIPSDYSTNETIPVEVKFTGDTAQHVKGFYVTNSTYAALSMKYGDAYSKKFGGADGNDADWFKLSIAGYQDGEKTDTVEFYLADYRFDDNSKDYIVETWQWVELSSLGKVDSLAFDLSSSDVGTYGMNTPSYFCIDNLYFGEDEAPVVNQSLADINEKSNAENMEIVLSESFTDPDNADSLMSFSLKSNSDEDVVSLSVEQDTLILDFNKVGTSTAIIEALSNDKAVYDTVEITVVADQLPSVANPIGNVIVKENAADTTIDLSNVFTDPDNENDSIVKTVKRIGNPDLVKATINDEDLTLSFSEDMTGESDVVIEAVSGKMTVVDSFRVKVTEATAIDEIAPLEMNIYPNPSNGKFRVNSDEHNTMMVVVYDMTGQVVYENRNYYSDQPIDISNRPDGSYIVKVKQGRMINSKVIIKR